MPLTTTYRPFLFGWRAECTENGLQLVHVAFAGEIRRAQHELREDTADGPDIDGGAVVPTAEKQFRRSVPSAKACIGAGQAQLVNLGAPESGETGEGEGCAARTHRVIT